MSAGGYEKVDVQKAGGSASVPRLHTPLSPSLNQYHTPKETKNKDTPLRAKAGGGTRKYTPPISDPVARSAGSKDTAPPSNVTLASTPKQRTKPVGGKRRPGNKPYEIVGQRVKTAASTEEEESKPQKAADSSQMGTVDYGSSNKKAGESAEEQHISRIPDTAEEVRRSETYPKGASKKQGGTLLLQPTAKTPGTVSPMSTRQTTARSTASGTGKTLYQHLMVRNLESLYAGGSGQKAAAGGDEDENESESVLDAGIVRPTEDRTGNLIRCGILLLCWVPVVLATFLCLKFLTDWMDNVKSPRMPGSCLANTTLTPIRANTTL